MTIAASSNASAPSPGQAAAPSAGSSRRRRLPRSSRALTFAASLCAAVVGTHLAAPSQAEAGVPRVLRPGTRPMAFLLGLGPSWGIRDRYRYGYGFDGPGNGCGNGNPYCRGGFYGGFHAFKLTQEFMGHFSGNASGAALGILMNQEFAVLRPQHRPEVHLRHPGQARPRPLHLAQLLGRLPPEQLSRGLLRLLRL